MPNLSYFVKEMKNGEFKISNKIELEYELAKEFFLKRAPGMFLNEKSLSGFESEALNAIKMAKFFIETYEKQNK